jgi:hypothetical protein
VELYKGRTFVSLVSFVVIVAAACERPSAQSTAPVIVVETTKGSFGIETYPTDAPKTVAHDVPARLARGDLIRRMYVK